MMYLLSKVNDVLSDVDRCRVLVAQRRFWAIEPLCLGDQVLRLLEDLGATLYAFEP